AVNVRGTANALALAGRLDVPLVHVSTAYVCGLRTGPVAEAELPPDGFANGYEASKAEAERLCRAAIAQGQPVVVARPSILVGGFADGAIRRFGDIYLLLRLFALGRLRTMPAVAEATLDLVAIDRVAAAIALLAEQPRAFLGRTLHLTSGAPVALADLAAEAATRGYPVPRFVAPEAFDPRDLPAAEARLHRGIGALYASYLARSPLFDRSNAAALPGFDQPCGGPALLGRIVSFAIASGFLPPARLSARPGSAAPAPA
ncbi:MAG: SDR family oxidoreductase, partial [Sphingomonadaceae bacterium]